MGFVNSVGPKGTSTATHSLHISGIRGQEGGRDLPMVTWQVRAYPALRSRPPDLHVFAACLGSANLSGSAETSSLKTAFQTQILLTWHHTASSFLTSRYPKVLEKY